MIATPVIEAKVEIPTNGRVRVPYFILPTPSIFSPESGVGIPIDEPDYPYGWRTIMETGPNGEEISYDIALTPEDFLNPQLGDQMPQGLSHSKLTIEIHDKLENHLQDKVDMIVISDIQMFWDVPGLEKRPFPDVCVIPHIKDEEDLDESFDCRKHHTRPCLIVEVTSPNYEKGDLKKVEIYQRAGVKEYIIINPQQKRKSRAFELMGYRLEHGRYKRIEPDRDGRLLSQTTGVLFGLKGQAKRKIELINAATGKPLLSNREEKARAVQAESLAQTESIRANAESIARTQAESLAKAESIRANAESIRANAEAIARTQAESRAAMLEARLRELEKLLPANMSYTEQGHKLKI